AMHNTCTCRHALHITSTDNRTAAQAIAMAHLTAQHIGNNLHISVRVHTKTHIGGDYVLVDYTQYGILHVVWVVITTKRERMIAIQPAVVGMAALFRFS